MITLNKHLKRLIDLRESKDLKKIEVAKVLGMTRSSYGHIEAGRREISLLSLDKLANLYNTSTDYIMGITNNKKANPSAKAYNPRKLADRLITLRNQNNESQKQVAKATGISQSTYARYETNKITPRVNTLIRIAKHFNVSLDYIMGKV